MGTSRRDYIHPPPLPSLEYIITHCWLVVVYEYYIIPERVLAISYVSRYWPFERLESERETLLGAFDFSQPRILLITHSRV